MSDERCPACKGPRSQLYRDILDTKICEHPFHSPVADGGEGERYETTVSVKPSPTHDGYPVSGCDGDAMAELTALRERMEELEYALRRVAEGDNGHDVAPVFGRLRGIADAALNPDTQEDA